MKTQLIKSAILSVIMTLPMLVMTQANAKITDNQYIEKTLQYNLFAEVVDTLGKQSLDRSKMSDEKKLILQPCVNREFTTEKYNQFATSKMMEYLSKVDKSQKSVEFDMLGNSDMHKFFEMVKLGVSVSSKNKAPTADEQKQMKEYMDYFKANQTAKNTIDNIVQDEKYSNLNRFLNLSAFTNREGFKNDLMGEFIEQKIKLCAADLS